jgi:hypothetical protein
MLTGDAALVLADAWSRAWNTHDLEAILSHYADDVEFVSPFIVKLLDDPSGTVRGKAALGAYFARALATYPDLHFEPIAVLTSVGSLVHYYRSVGGLLAAEVMFVDERGKIARVVAHYDAAL